MYRFALLLFIFGLGQSIHAASVLPFPDLTRRIPERPTSPGCAYKGVRYAHGDSVPTPEPCLNCTCIRAVLVCYLRVCPTATAPPAGCFAAREVGECCPTLVCGGIDLSSPSNKSGLDNDLRPIFQPPQETTDNFSSESNYSTVAISSTDSTADSIEFNDNSTKIGDENGVITFNEAETTAVEVIEDVASTIADDSSEVFQGIKVSPTDAYSTVSGNTQHLSSNENDSLVYISSTREPTTDANMNFHNDIPAGGCLVNGTLYADGSAMLSSTFCEYCFCIRGKSTCVKPKCHLTIEGCTPRYDYRYTCCPTRYECTYKTSSVESGDTTISSSTDVEITTQFLGDMEDCFINGTMYHQGDLIPSHKSCHNCYCKNSSVRCEKIKCSPPLEGCSPIIPQGYCCPISYRCDYERGSLVSNSIKGSKLNNSTTVISDKATDIKSMKNFYIHDNEDVHLKTPTERELISLLHNIVPIKRRLDQNSQSDQNFTLKSFDKDSVIQIGYGVHPEIHKNANKNIDSSRENDKTLKLQSNESASVIYPLEERTFEGINFFQRAKNSENEASGIETISTGPPVVQTLSIQELFNQFFGRQKVNISKVPVEAFLEPKRNNSKQPTSIVEIYEDYDSDPESTTLKASVQNAQTILKENGKNNETLSNESEDLKMHPFSFGDSVITDMTDSFSDTTDSRTMEIFDTTFNDGKDENSSLLSTVDYAVTGNLRTGKSTQSTYPTFINTSQEDNKKNQSETVSYPEVKTFTSTEDVDYEDVMKTSPSSNIFKTTGDILDLKSEFLSQTHTTFGITDLKDIYNDKTNQAQSISPDYSTTKASLIEKLKSQTDSRPVVFIYDLKNIHNKNPTTHKVIQPTLSLHQTTIPTFSDKLEDDSFEQQTISSDEITKIIIAENSEDQTDSSSSSSTEDDSYVTNNHAGFFPISLIHITRKNPTNFGISETRQTDLEISDTTKHVNQEYKTRTPLPEHYFTTTKHTDNYDKTATVLHSLTSPRINFSDNEHSVTPHTNIINQHSANTMQHKKTINTNLKDSDNLSDTNLNSVRTYYTKTTINEDFSTKPRVLNTSPSIEENSKYDQYGNKKEQALNIHQNSETFSTPNISENKWLDKSESSSTTETNFSATKVKDKDYLGYIVPDASIINTQKDTSTTKTSKASTRINSKLPSFNYGEKIVQNSNNASFPNYSILTDSYINTNLSTKEKYFETEKQNFTNIGSVYLGAPLAVRGSDFHKDTDDTKPKVTHSDGVIFLDPKFTDIKNKLNFESIENDQKDKIAINNQEQIFVENPNKDFNANEKKKGPRNQDQSKTGQGFKIIPFVAEDAVKGQFSKINDSLLVQPGVTEGLPDIVSDFCFIKGRIYMNGEMIGKPDPCELCRCFYGRELCQIQRCPTPPPDCVPDKVPGFCCPRFTCGNNKNPSDEMKLVGIVLPSVVSVSTTRKPEIIDQIPPINDKPEVKFGIRVRVRSSVTPSIKTSEYVTEAKTMLEKATLKPEIRTISSKSSTTKATTITSIKPDLTTKTPTTKRNLITAKITTQKTTPSSLFPDPWGLLKVSGCNIYGKFFNINDQVEILSGPCSHCICTTNGVECNDIC